MILKEFDIEYIDYKVIKGQGIANQLEEAPIIVDHSLVLYFLDEAIFIVTTNSQ